MRPKKTIELAEAEGYRNMKDLIKAGTKIHAGDKVYMDYMGKAIVLFQAGTAPVEEGMNILGAHIDSPRIDVKQNPLYENEGLAYLDTHYYGGVKKYQWLSIPLALHGVIVKKNGEKSRGLRFGGKKRQILYWLSMIFFRTLEQDRGRSWQKILSMGNRWIF